jgi:hypothetical protein
VCGVLFCGREEEMGMGAVALKFRYLLAFYVTCDQDEYDEQERGMKGSER